MSEVDKPVVHMSTGRPEAGRHYAQLYDAAQSQLAALREELAKFDEGMRALACSLGAGGYNAETLTADQLVGKVQWGIDNIITVQEQRLADAERRNEVISAELEVEKTNAAHWKATIAGEGQISKEARRYRGIRDILPLNEVIEITANCQTSAEWDLAIDVALNPNPEAASHDE
jgi:hypothetical protein